jgi:hypothetical protein
MEFNFDSGPRILCQLSFVLCIPSLLLLEFSRLLGSNSFFSRQQSPYMSLVPHYRSQEPVYSMVSGPPPIQLA